MAVNGKELFVVINKREILVLLLGIITVLNRLSDISRYTLLDLSVVMY